MKRTRSYYLGRFRTIDQLLFMVTIFVAGMGLCMVLWSLDLLTTDSSDSAGKCGSWLLGH